VEHQREAFERSAGALGRRERTVAEMEAWLDERGYDPEVVAATIARLVELDALDDERFALRYAEDKRELQGWGPARIRAGLTRRGIEPGLIEAALGGSSQRAELERAVALLRARETPLGSDPERARALGFLTRRGYDYELAYEAIRIAGERRAAA
jgi:regulatory protein